MEAINLIGIWPYGFIFLFLFCFVLYFCLRKRQHKYVSILKQIVSEESQSPLLILSIDKLSLKIIKGLEGELKSYYKQIVSQSTSLELGKFILCHKKIKNQKKQDYLINLIEDIVVKMPISDLSDMITDNFLSYVINTVSPSINSYLFQFSKLVLNSFNKVTNSHSKALIVAINEKFTKRFENNERLEEYLLIIMRKDKSIFTDKLKLSCK